MLPVIRKLFPDWIRLCACNWLCIQSIWLKLLISLPFALFFFLFLKKYIPCMVLMMWTPAPVKIPVQTSSAHGSPAHVGFPVLLYRDSWCLHAQEQSQSCMCGPILHDPCWAPLSARSLQGVLAVAPHLSSKWLKPGMTPALPTAFRVAQFQTNRKQWWTREYVRRMKRAYFLPQCPMRLLHCHHFF